MFDEFLKVSCGIVFPLIVVMFVMKSWVAIFPLLVIIGVVVATFGTAKGFAQADAARTRRSRNRNRRRRR